MKVRLLPSTTGGSPQQYLTTFLVNDTVAIDAGSIGFSESLEEQRRVRDIFISHTHVDHLASLPVFLENTYTPTPDCVRVYGSAAVLQCLRKDVFNNRLWPDFIGLSKSLPPFLDVETLVSGRPVEASGVRVTPVDVNHVVPTHGFVVEQGETTVVVAGDTGPTDELWRVARATGNLRAVFLECSFSDSLGWLADETLHLTPSRLQRELDKLPRGIPVFVVHVKSFCRDDVVRELRAIGDDRIQLCTPGKVYEFR